MYRTATVAQIEAAAREFAAKVGDGFKVSPNGYSHRTECKTCGWSRVDAMVSETERHARQCAAAERHAEQNLSIYFR